MERLRKVRHGLTHAKTGKGISGPADDNVVIAFEQGEKRFSYETIRSGVNGFRRQAMENVESTPLPADGKAADSRKERDDGSASQFSE